MCQRCNGGCSSCKCTCKKRCINENCTCSVFISSDCVTSFTEDLPCSGILAGGTLNETIIALDAYICEKFGSVSAFFALVSVGTGAKVYKGVNNLGQKEIKSLVDSGLITITEQTNTVTIAVNETALSAFVKVNQLTYSAVNSGEGENIIATNTVVGNNTQFNVKSIKSDTLSITSTGTEISIEQPMSATIPALYVNSAYIPTYDDFISGNTKGEGTLAKPYTNTVLYASPVASPTITANTAIQNALDAYVGIGTRLSPELAGQQIIIQNSNSTYTFPGNFNYSFLNLKIEGNILSTTSGFLVDMDNASNFNPTTSTVKIEIIEGFTLEVVGAGFNNSGNSVSTTTYATGRVIEIKGDGELLSQTNNVNYYLFNSDPNGVINGTTGNNNDGSLCFLVSCNISSRLQGIVKVGGKSKIDFNDSIIRVGSIGVSVNPALKVFDITGGTIGFYNNQINFYGGSRQSVLYITSQNSFLPSVIGRGNTLQGESGVVFTKSTSGLVNFDWQDGKSINLSVNVLFASPNLWNIVFNNNNIEANVDFSVVDFNQTFGLSTLNLLGGYVVASLIMASSRKEAVDNGVDKYSLFINRKIVNAGSFVVGVEYKIASIGSTDYTAIGASANTVGLHFTASNVGSGSGQAYLDKLDIVT